MKQQSKKIKASTLHNLRNLALIAGIAAKLGLSKMHGGTKRLRCGAPGAFGGCRRDLPLMRRQAIVDRDTAQAKKEALQQALLS